MLVDKLDELHVTAERVRRPFEVQILYVRQHGVVFEGASEDRVLVRDRVLRRWSSLEKNVVQLHLGRRHVAGQHDFPRPVLFDEGQRLVRGQVRVVWIVAALVDHAPSREHTDGAHPDVPVLVHVYQHQIVVVRGAVDVGRRADDVSHLAPEGRTRLDLVRHHDGVVLGKQHRHVLAECEAGKPQHERVVPAVVDDLLVLPRQHDVQDLGQLDRVAQFLLSVVYPVRFIEMAYLEQYCYPIPVFGSVFIVELQVFG